MENIINFTKIGIVKCDEFEVTFNDFIKKMSYLIMNDCDAYNVFYNDKEDKYFITYNFNRYVVKYGGEYLSKSTSDEVVEYLDHKVTKQEMIDKIKQESRRYAKRQLTWFRKNKETIWLDGTNNIQNNIEVILEEINNSETGEKFKQK